MKVTKEQFVAEIMAHQKARRAEIDAGIHFLCVDEAVELKSTASELFGYTSGLKYRGKYRTQRGFEC